MIKTGIVLYAHFFKENFTETSVEPIWQGVKGEGCEYVGEYNRPSSLPWAGVVYSYFGKGCRKKCSRDNPER